MVSEALEKLLEQDRISEPAKRWRNWVYLERGGYSSDDTGTGRRRYTKGVNPGANLYPSKDIAETEWFKTITHPRFQYWIARGVRYLGAFPEGERP